MNLFDDQNKTEITKLITAATCFWLDERGCKPVETEVSVAFGWIADIASVISPSNTELQELKLIRRAPKWSKRSEREAWESEVLAMVRMMTVIVEVKTSRSDFLGDKKWTSPPIADLNWISAPSGLIGESERPSGWGILEYSESRDCMVTRCIPHIMTTTMEQQRNLIHAVATRRDNQSRYEHIRRISRAHRSEGNERISVARVRDAMRAALSIAHGEHGSVEGALDAHRIKLRNIGELEMLKLTRLWNCSSGIGQAQSGKKA